MKRMNQPHIIFIVIDTLRRDFSNSLNIELSKMDFISYDNVIAPSPWTTPTHASIFTGMYPIIHGAHESYSKKDIDIVVSNKYDLITDVLSEKNYNLTLLSANPYVGPEFGFRGFNSVYSVPHILNMSLLNNDEKSTIEKLKETTNESKEIINRLINNKEFFLLTKLGLEASLKKPYRFLQSKFQNWPEDKGVTKIKEYVKNQNFEEKTSQFIFINLMEVHDPYYVNDTMSKDFVYNLKNNTVNKKKITAWKEIYHKEVEYVQKKLFEIFSILQEKNMFDSSLIIVTSDHGQLLGEHNRIWHGLFLFNELIDVPLWIKYPNDNSIEICDFSDKYISHVNFKQFLLEFVNDSLKSDELLYSKTVFSESYGLTSSNYLPLFTYSERKQLEKYKIAVFKNGIKCIFNVNDWKFENISEDNNDNSIISCDEDIFKKEIISFLKKRQLISNVKTVLPSKQIFS